MVCKRGDRFQCSFPEGTLVIQYVDSYFEVIDSSWFDYIPGDRLGGKEVGSQWTCLGNFDKSNKFKEIYKILNDEA
jgi:hypothetical protein